MEKIKSFFKKVSRTFEIYVCERVAAAKGYEKIQPEKKVAQIDGALDRLEAALDKAIQAGV